MSYTPGKGSTLSLEGVEVAQITKLTPPSSEMGTVETTNLQDDVKTFLATIRDSGEAQFTIEWDPALHASLWTAHRNGVKTPPDTLYEWEIEFQDEGSTTATFEGILTKFPWDEIDVESVVTIPITIKISGDITIA